jgi:hypothetical protein
VQEVEEGEDDEEEEQKRAQSNSRGKPYTNVAYTNRNTAAYRK